jgi:hypothetical protein
MSHIVRIFFNYRKLTFRQRYNICRFYTQYNILAEKVEKSGMTVNFIIMKKKHYYTLFKTSR